MLEKRKRNGGEMFIGVHERDVRGEAISGIEGRHCEVVIMDWFRR